MRRRGWPRAWTPETSRRPSPVFLDPARPARARRSGWEQVPGGALRRRGGGEATSAEERGVGGSWRRRGCRAGRTSKGR
eukprot:6655159-Pyramimonas_sp.AAC.1